MVDITSDQPQKGNFAPARHLSAEEGRERDFAMQGGMRYDPVDEGEGDGYSGGGEDEDGDEDEGDYSYPAWSTPWAPAS